MTPAEELLALLEGAEFSVRTLLTSYFVHDFGEVLAVEVSSMRKARRLLDGMGVSLDPPAAAVPVAAAVPAAAVPAAAVPAAVAGAGIAAIGGLQADALFDDDDFPDDDDTQDEPLPEVVSEPDPAPFRPPPAEIDPEATELDIVGDDYAEDATMALGMSELEPIPEDSMEEDTSDPVTLGDPDETEDLLRENSEERGFTPPSIDDPEFDDLEELDEFEDLEEIEELEELDDEIEIEEELEVEIEIDEPGVDALVTIEDTSDPRSDLDGLNLNDSDLLDDDDDLASDEVVVRNSKMVPPAPRSLQSDFAADEEETFVADLADIQRMKAKMDEDTMDDASNAEVMVPRRASPKPAPRVATPRVAGVSVAGVKPAAAVAGAGGVAAGLYGNPNTPQIRERNAPKPRAAALQIGQALEQANAGGSGNAALEDEEILELGSSEDYGEEEVEHRGGGFGVEMQEYEDEYEDEIEEEELELEEEDDVALEPIDDGPDPAVVAKAIADALKAIEEGELETAIHLFSDAIDMDAGNLDCHVRRGRLYLDYGDYSRAMSDFTIAADIDRSSPEPEIAVGDLYFARKDYNRAIGHFDAALLMDPNHAMAFCRRGISHYYRKNYSDALQDLNKAQKLDGDIPNIRTYIAMAKKKAKR